jgi:class 3 adenylate cyclase
VRCGQCGASIAASDRFCGACGAPSVTCPSCGEPVTSGYRFCRSCGSALPESRAAGPVPGPAATPSAAAGLTGEPVAERRVCSVLFCDVVGFTAGTMLAGVRDLRATEAAPAAFAAAVDGLRKQGTPYHLAHGLLDHAQHQIKHGDGQAAALAIDEARAIGRRLRCQPLLDRADATEQAQPRIRARP